MKKTIIKIELSMLYFFDEKDYNRLMEAMNATYNQPEERVMNTALIAALNELAADLRPSRDYSTICDSADLAELPLNDLPANVQETVRLTVFTRKGERFYMVFKKNIALSYHSTELRTTMRMNTALIAALNELAADLRPSRDYSTICDSAKSAELPLNDLPANVQESMLAGSPLCETVRLTVFSNKGERFYMASAQKGSREGQPLVCVPF